MVPGSSAKWAAKWLREILTALREIGREMIPRNFAQPSAKFSQPSAKFVREIFRSDYQAQLFEFGTASAKFPGQIFEKNSKKVLREIGENLVEFGGGVRCNLADFGGDFKALFSGHFRLPNCSSHEFWFLKTYITLAAITHFLVHSFSCRLFRATNRHPPSL